MLETPLFRVRNKKKTIYCYSEAERVAAMKSLPNREITRFKGLGEISPKEFKPFIGKDMRLSPVEVENCPPRAHPGFLHGQEYARTSELYHGVADGGDGQSAAGKGGCGKQLRSASQGARD